MRFKTSYNLPSHALPNTGTVSFTYSCENKATHKTTNKVSIDISFVLMFHSKTNITSTSFFVSTKQTDGETEHDEANHNLPVNTQAKHHGTHNQVTCNPSTIAQATHFFSSHFSTVKESYCESFIG